MTKEERLKHLKHCLEVYQERLANKEEDNFCNRKLGYRNACLRRERLRGHIKDLQKEIKELEDDRNY
jgi:hypothetical protein|nr:MAG TPA: hypothetical protein [Caudoviricetes sp.]